MNDTYVECLVKRKTPSYMTLLKTLSIMLTVCFVLIGLVIIYALLIGVVFGVAAYFIYINADLEYEYLYVDKELSIDKVMAKSKRKKAGVFDINKLEMMAPVNSYHLDEFKNRQVKESDYSSGVASQPEARYALYLSGNTKVIIEPNEELIKAIKNIAPRKVFTD